MISIDDLLVEINNVDENSEIVNSIILLRKIEDFSTKKSEYQIKLGSSPCVKFVSQFFTGLFDSKLIHCSVVAAIHLCRRELLLKSSICDSNLSEFRCFVKQFVSLLRIYIDDVDIVLVLCQLIMVVSSDSTECQKQFCDEGICEVIVSVLQRHELDSGIVEMACRAVRNLSSNDEVACKFTEDGIGERMEFFLRTSSDNKVLTAAVWAVVNLSYDIDVAALLGSVGCCKAVVDVVQNGVLMNNLNEINTAVCWAIRNLSCPPLNLGILATTNVCELVRSMIVQGTENEDYDLVQSAIWCVNNLSCNLLLRKQLHLLDAADLILDTCLTCNRLLTEDVTLGPIAEASIFALRSLAVQSVLQENECDEKDKLTVSSKQDKLGLGVCPLVCGYLAQFIDREGMVESCFATIACLCRDNVSNKNSIGGCDGLSIICSAIDKHREVLETVEMGLKTLLTVTVDHINNSTLFLKIGGVQKVVQFAQKWKTDYDICSTSCELLLQLKCFDEEGLNHLVTCDQLTEDKMHARPAGRFEDIAIAWKFSSFAVSL